MQRRGRHKNTLKQRRKGRRIAHQWQHDKQSGAHKQR